MQQTRPAEGVFPASPFAVLGKAEVISSRAGRKGPNGSWRHAPQVLDWFEIENMDRRPLGGAEGVFIKILWQDPAATSYAGLMRIEPGASLARHTHRFAAHHLFVVEGTARVGLRWLRAGVTGSCRPAPRTVFPKGDPQGCVLFFNYLSLADFD